MPVRICEVYNKLRGSFTTKHFLSGLYNTYIYIYIPTNLFRPVELILLMDFCHGYEITVTLVNTLENSALLV